MDEQGNPAGGETVGIGFTIVWQGGPLRQGDEYRSPNGAFVEDIIQAAIGKESRPVRINTAAIGKRIVDMLNVAYGE